MRELVCWLSSAAVYFLALHIYIYYIPLPYIYLRLLEFLFDSAECCQDFSHVFFLCEGVQEGIPQMDRIGVTQLARIVCQGRAKQRHGGSVARMHGRSWTHGPYLMHIIDHNSI